VLLLLLLFCCWFFVVVCCGGGGGAGGAGGGGGRRRHRRRRVDALTQMKEEECYVSMDFISDLKDVKTNKFQSKHCVEYVLPDFGAGL
jgi:hypothetical protein